MGLLSKLKSFFTSGKSEPPNQMHYSAKPEMPDEWKLNETKPEAIEEETIVDKTKDFINNTVEEVKEQSSALWDEVKAKSSELNDATKVYREKLAEKANETLENIDDFVDATVQKAKEFQEKEQVIDKDKDGFADKPIDFGKGISEEKKDFFSKAEKWIEEHDNSVKSKVENTTSSPESTVNKVIHPIELPQDTE